MKLADFNKLKKLMNMTQSGAEQERLTAIDAANAIVKKSDTTWDRILDRVIKVDVMVESVEAATGGDAAIAARTAALRKQVDEAFKTIEESDPRGNWADFVASLKDQWERRGKLSEAQINAVLRGARNVEERVRR